MARAGASEIDWIGDASEVCVMLCSVCREKRGRRGEQNWYTYVSV